MKLDQLMNQKSEDLFEARMNAPFPWNDRISQTWRMATRTAIMQTTPLSLRIGLGQFASVVGCEMMTGSTCDDAKLSIFEFGILSNCLESVTPDQLVMNPDEYRELINEAVELIKLYQKHIEKVKEQVRLEMEAEYETRMVALGGTPVKKINGERGPQIGQA